MDEKAENLKRIFEEEYIERLMKNVWVVSWYNDGEHPVVSVFNNEEAAQKYYQYECGNQMHAKVDIDKCPVYSTFTICK